MQDTFFIEDWPPWMRWFAAREKGGGHGRHRRPDDLQSLRWSGGGPFGSGPGFGPYWRGRGRRRRGEVRSAILLLLAEQPRNGYQLMQVIEECSEGRWRPSPGSVYPVLAQLKDEGLVRSTERDGAKLFELTDAGQQQVVELRDARPPWAVDDEDALGTRDLRRLIAQVAAAAMQVRHLGDATQVEQAVEALKNTRRTLYRILAEEDEA